MAEIATDTRHMALKMLGDLRADRYVARAFGHQLASIERAVRIGAPDDRCPSYNGLLIIAQSVCGALARAGLTDCDDPGEAIDVMRERYEARIAELESTTPAHALTKLPERQPVGGSRFGWQGEYNRGWNDFRAALIAGASGEGEPHA